MPPIDEERKQRALALRAEINERTRCAWVLADDAVRQLRRHLKSTGLAEGPDGRIEVAWAEAYREAFRRQGESFEDLL